MKHFDPISITIWRLELGRRESLLRRATAPERSPMSVITLPLVFLALFLFCPTARAELNFWNLSPVTIQTAMHKQGAGGKWQTEGWWTIKPGERVTVIGGDLTNRYYYAYAETPGGKWKWEGSTELCVRYEEFTIVDNTCEADSLRKFDKIDTGDATSFDYKFNCPLCMDPGLVNAARQNIPFLEALANSAAPLQYRTNDWQDIGPVDIQYGVSRSPFRLSVYGNCVTISTRLFYWLSVSHTRLFGARTGLGSCGVNEAQPWADVTIRVIFGVTPDGRLASKTWPILSFPSRCNLTIFNIDATGYVQKIAWTQLERLAATIDTRIGEINVSQFVNVKKLY